MDDARCQRASDTERMPDGNHQRPDPGGICIGDRGRWNPRTGDAEQREIDVRVTRDEAAFEAATIDQAHRHT